MEIAKQPRENREEEDKGRGDQPRRWQFCIPILLGLALTTVSLYSQDMPTAPLPTAPLPEAELVEPAEPATWLLLAIGLAALALYKRGARRR